MSEMTSPAVKLAKKCVGYGGGKLMTFTHKEVESFYTKAQAQILRDIADWFERVSWEGDYPEIKLRQKANELEKSTCLI